MTDQAPRVAIVHSWLNQYGGAERVLEQLYNLFPEAPIYTSMYEPKALPRQYQSWDIRTSFLQGVPFSRSKHQIMLYFYPLAFESFDLSEYDLVISLSSGFSHGVRVPDKRRHVSYCLTPPRFLWSFDSYAKLEGVGWGAQLALSATVPVLRRWDYRAAQRVGRFVTISHVVEERIARSYGREAPVIYPGIEVDAFAPSEDVDDCFLVVSRLIPYKRIDLAIEACNRLKLPLKIVGDGRSRAVLERLAGPTIEFLGRTDDATTRRLYARSRALIFPGDEDLGLTPIEAQAAGRPVIAYGHGGTRETVVEGVTGAFFAEQTVDSLVSTLQGFDPRDYHSGAIRQLTRDRFDVSVFRQQFKAFVLAQV